MESKQHIAEVALQMFQEHGFKETRVTDICKKVNCARSTLYNHFDSKIDILEYSFTFEFLTERGELEMIEEESDVAERLLKIHAHFIAHASSVGVDLLALHYIHTLQNESRVVGNRDYRKQNEVLIPYIEEAQRQGVVNNRMKAYDLAFTSIMLVAGLLRVWIRENGTFDLNEQARYFLMKLYEIH